MRQCFGRRALRGGRGDRRRSSQAGAGGRCVCHTQSGENLCSYAAAAAAASCSISSFSPLPSSLSEGMRRQFVPGHFFRFADNKPSRFASLLPSLLSFHRASSTSTHADTRPRSEWRYDNAGDVNIASLFIAPFLFIGQLWFCT